MGRAVIAFDGVDRGPACLIPGGSSMRDDPAGGHASPATTLKT